MKELEFLTKQWRAVSSDPLPEQVKKSFLTQIMPMLKTSPLTDPYIVDATTSIINAYFLASATKILQNNARSSQELEKTVNGVLKTKLIFRSCFLVSSTLVIIATIMSLAFFTGLTLGAQGSESWNARQIRLDEKDLQYKLKKEEKQHEYNLARLEFLKTVNADLMQCKDGKIHVQKNGKRACFYDGGWFID